MKKVSLMIRQLTVVLFAVLSGLGVHGQGGNRDTGRADPSIVPKDSPLVRVDSAAAAGKLLLSLRDLSTYIVSDTEDQNFPCKKQLEDYCRKVTQGGGAVIPKMLAAGLVFLKDKDAGKHCLEMYALFKGMDTLLRQATKTRAVASAVADIRLKATNALRPRPAADTPKKTEVNPDTPGRVHTTPTPVHGDTNHILPAPQPPGPTSTASPAVSWPTVITVAVALLVFSAITLTGVWIMIGRMKAAMNRQSPDVRPETAPIRPVSNLSLPPDPVLPSPDPVRPPPDPVPVPPAPAAPASRKLVCEVLMAAGPRKDPADKEADTSLGEDICGLVTGTDEVVTWVLDGTSDSIVLREPGSRREYFSCRLLAQSIARQLKPAFASVNKDDMEKLVQQAAAAVREEWRGKLRALPVVEQQFLHDLIQDSKAPVCSTAILIARLSLDGRMWAYRCGDSKLLVFTEKDGNLTHTGSALADKHSVTNDRLYFKIIEDDSGELDIWYSAPKNEQTTESDVRIVIGFSDGIGDQSVALMKQWYAHSPEKVREELAYQLQGTGDDKSLCILEIVLQRPG